jgi:hypothetical protein
MADGVTVPGVPGTWNIWSGMVNARPIVNYVRVEGDDLEEIAVDLMSFLDDARDRKYDLPGDDILAISFGFKVWAGPVTNLTLDDFCLDIQ